MTKNYYDVFGDDFPSLDDEDCKLDENELLYYKDKKKLKGKNTRRCITNVYDVLKCPFLLFEKDYSYNVPSDHMRDLCGVYNSSLLYLTEKKDINSNIENKVPLDTLFDGNGKYPFDYPEFDIKILVNDNYQFSEEQKMNLLQSQKQFFYSFDQIMELKMNNIDFYIVDEIKLGKILSKITNQNFNLSVSKLFLLEQEEQNLLYFSDENKFISFPIIPEEESFTKEQIKFANFEGLDAHANSIKVRFEEG